MQFAGIVTPQSIVFTSPEGKPFNVTSAHVNFDAMRDVFKKLQAALKLGESEETKALHEKLASLADIPKTVIAASANRVIVKDGVVYYADQPVHNAITDRILWGIKEGYDMGSYLLFLDNLMDNPSKRAVDELYDFIETHKMGITDDGYIIAYKKIRADYTDIYTGKFDNSPGKSHTMPRNRVDDDKNRTCSDGFHFCAFDYLPKFGASSGNRVVIVKVNPKDVVSIPADYNAAKARCCHYEIIGEYTGADLVDVLGSKPVFTGNDWQTDDAEDDADADDDYDYDSSDDDFWNVEDDLEDEADDFDDESDQNSLTHVMHVEDPIAAPFVDEEVEIPDPQQETSEEDQEIPVQDVRVGFDPTTGMLRKM